MSENYLTRPALERWIRDVRKGDRECAALVEALYSDWFNDRPARRHHFDMKRGRAGGTTHSATLYEGASDSLRKTIAKGFGKDVSGAFDGDAVAERDLRDEGAWDEVSGLLRDIMARAQ